MKTRYLPFIVLFVLGFSFFACEQENFDTTIEKVLPTDSTTIVKNEGTFKYRIEGREAVTSNGYGRRDFNDYSSDNFYVISSSYIASESGSKSSLGWGGKSTLPTGLTRKFLLANALAFFTWALVSVGKCVENQQLIR